MKGCHRCREVPDPHVDQAEEAKAARISLTFPLWGVVWNSSAILGLYRL
jgi:hypothetical protein